VTIPLLIVIALLAAANLAIPVGLFVFLRQDRAAEREERQVWLQRIQDPRAAVHEHHQKAAPAAEVPVSALPMSDEEIALMQNTSVPDGESELARIIARMEAVENGSVQLEDGLIP
jgi:hypothetical protein